MASEWSVLAPTAGRLSEDCCDGPSQLQWTSLSFSNCLPVFFPCIPVYIAEPFWLLKKKNLLKWSWHQETHLISRDAMWFQPIFASVNPIGLTPHKTTFMTAVWFEPTLLCKLLVFSVAVIYQAKRAHKTFVFQKNIFHMNEHSIYGWFIHFLNI